MNLNKEQYEELLEAFNIPKLPTEPNYWFIRTEGGSFYNIFKAQKYVSIGYDKVDLDLIVDKKDDAIKDEIALLYPDCKRPGVIVSQLRRFKYNVKKGDIILIPDKSSRNLCIGQATSDVYQLSKKDKQLELNSEIYTYEKRIDTTWFAEIPKNNFDLYIYKLLNSHQAIVSCDLYKSFVNRMVFPIYVQDGNMHLSINIDKKENITFLNYQGLFEMLDSCIKLYNDIMDTELKPDINVKVTANSPGVFEILGDPKIIIAIVIGFALVGGKIKYKNTKKETQLNIESEGILEKISKLYEQYNRTKIKLVKTLIDRNFDDMQLNTSSKEKVIKREKIIDKPNDNNQTSLFD